MSPIPGLTIEAETAEETETESTTTKPDLSPVVTAIGGAVIVGVVATGIIVAAAGVLKLITWVLGGIASVMTAIAPWAAVFLGIAAYSAYRYY